MMALDDMPFQPKSYFFYLNFSTKIYMYQGQWISKAGSLVGVETVKKNHLWLKIYCVMLKMLNDPSDFAEKHYLFN